MAQQASDRTGIIIASRMWEWGGWVPSIALAAGANHLISRSVGVGVMGVVLQSVGVGLLTGGVCLCLLWLAYTAWKAMPSQRFSRMEKNLAVALSYFNPASMKRSSPDLMRAEDGSSARMIIRQLDKLKVQHPGMDGKGSDWSIYLKRIIGEARAGALPEARLVWGQMRGRKEGQQ